MIYQLLFRLLLQRIDEEKAHALASRSLRVAVAIPGVRHLMQWVLTPRDPRTEVRTLGLTFPSPLGVGAGVDKRADWFDALGRIGFGAVEVGTVTAEPQDGSPRRRVFRLKSDRALLNRMGFPNPGARVIAERLDGRDPLKIVGVNIGKTATVSIEDAVADYRASAAQVAPLCDYLVVNVSSPNTPDLRSMQTPEALRTLIAAVREELRATRPELPILIKIGPDLNDHEIDTIADVALELELDGIVAINTTVDRSCLVRSREEAASYGEGAISGAPLKARALQVLRRLRARAGDDLVLVSVGGVEEPTDAWERIRAGASLVQAHTAFVYGGPLWPRRINRGLARLVRDAGGTSIEQFIGADDVATVQRGTQSHANGAVQHESRQPRLAASSRATRVAAPGTRTER